MLDSTGGTRFVAIEDEAVTFQQTNYCSESGVCATSEIYVWVYGIRRV
jgi:hypothetical protein